MLAAVVLVLAVIVAFLVMEIIGLNDARKDTIDDIRQIKRELADLDHRNQIRTGWYSEGRR